MVAPLTPNDYAPSVSFIRHNNPQNHPGASRAATSEAGRDKASISGEGRSAQLSRPLHAAGNQSVSVGSIEKDFHEATAYVENRLRDLFKKPGISDSSAMKMSVGNDGRIIVDGEKPTSRYLADAINADDELSNSIRGMSAMASVSAAAEKHLEFSEAYAEDPLAAVDRYGHLLENGHEYHVSFSMKDGHINTDVTYI